MTQDTSRKLSIAIKLALIVLLSALIALQVKTLRKLNEPTSTPVGTATVVMLSETPAGLDAGINLPTARYSDNDLGPSGTPICRTSNQLDVATSDLNNSDPGVDIITSSDATLIQ